jgi:hypothetical protein
VGQAGWIANNDIGGLIRVPLKDVCANELMRIRVETVEPEVFFGIFEGGFRNIDGNDSFRTGCCGVNGESSVVCKQVDHMLALAVSSHSNAVFALVQK